MGFVSVFTVTLLCMSGVSDAFLLDDLSCPVGDPCTCHRASTINCQKLDLQDVPDFNETDRDFGNMNVQLNANNITHIHSRAFEPLSKTQQRTITLMLQGNNIHTIDDDAFAGISSQITYINLEQNRLTHLPSALGGHHGLDHLKTLLLKNNPLKTLEYQIMHSLGRTLESFSFGMDSDQWPTTVSELRHVSRLVIDPLPVNYIPSHAFSHVPLQVLTFGKTGLEAIPNAVCSLRQLTTLSFDTDSVFDVNAMVPYCRHDNHHPSSLLSLTLRGTGITSIPDQLFKSFPTIDDLRITGTDDTYSWINDLVFPADNKITHLELNADHLVSIPSSVTSLPHLTSLDVSSNRISCGCLMKWMLDWELRDNVTIRGSCSNYQMSIQDFVTTKLETFCH